MLSKIIIKRRFQEGKMAKVLESMHDLRFAAMSQEGYVTGETLMQLDDPEKLVVIGTWQDIDNWHQWQNSAKRKELEAKLRREGKKKGLTGKRLDAYVYGTLRKTGWRPSDGGSVKVK